MVLYQSTLVAAVKKFDEFKDSKKNHAQVLRDASGAAMLGIEIAGSAGKKRIRFFSVTILVSVVVLLGLTGCSSRTPNIYKMDPGNLERIRSDIGRVGVTISSYPVERDLKKPAKGITGGMARGFVVGASTPVVIGALAPVPGGTFIGLLVAPFTAVAGGVYGATKGVPPEDIEKAQSDRIHDVTYELRIWTITQGPSGRLRYSRDSLNLASHKLEESLEPFSQYLWSVRARFMIDGNMRVTEWGMAGLPLRNESVPNLSCFRFKTPEHRL